VLLSSHALTELEERAGRVIIMNRGLKVADGSVQDLRGIAELPTRIRLRTREQGIEAAQQWFAGTPCHAINGHTLEISVAQDRKIEVLRRASSVGVPVVDIDVAPPNLDDLYAHFLQDREGASC
jgi:Cu-processing system ATP-binding protein